MLFSIITAVYNNKNEVLGAIESVAGQDGVKFEHIIMDGGSNDGTQEEIAKLNLPHIKLESSKDKGIYDALNKGIKRASGDIVGILHSDDLFADKNVLKDVQEKFEAGADVVYADLDYVYKNDVEKILRKWKSGEVTSSKLRYGWMPPHPTLFVRREVYQELGEFDLKYRISSDYDFILRLLLNPKYAIGYLPRTIVKMRVGGASNKSLTNIIKKSKEDYLIAKKHFAAPLVTIAVKNIRKVHQFF